MKIKAVLFLSVLFLSGLAVAAPPPIAFIKAQVTEVRGLLKVPVKDGSAEKKKIDDQLKALLNPVMNFERLSENALRNHWDKLTADERLDFIELFRALVFHSYLQKVRSAQEAYTIEYVEQVAKGANAASVTAEAKTKNVETELIFHVKREANQPWSVEDIVIDEVSLVDDYRQQFNVIIKKSGFATLLDKMSNKLTSIGGEIPERIIRRGTADKTLVKKKGAATKTAPKETGASTKRAPKK